MRSTVCPTLPVFASLVVAAALLAGCAPGARETATSGARIYADLCSACHGDRGQGAVGPALAGNDHLADTNDVVTRLLEGVGGMANFSALSDEQLAAVATHIRTSWGNRFGAVDAATVARLRTR